MIHPTDTSNSEYYHKVIDCQYACPAHTPVPQYIRLIAAGKYTDAYMVNWYSNVFPGVLGRTCDRPCEPACRRGRIDEEPVAICRLKRVAADFKIDISPFLPPIQSANGKKIALIGAGPSALTVARDLAPLGYEVHIYDEQHNGGGMMRSQIPSFRLPDEVLDEEVGYILKLGIHQHFKQRVESLKAILDKGYDAVYIGTGAPKGRDLPLPGRTDTDKIHIGVEWLANVSFEHTKTISKKVIVIGGGNTAMDCCRTARRLGGTAVKVVVRTAFDEMLASPWEIEDTQREDIPILPHHNPKAYIVENNVLKGMLFEMVRTAYDNDGREYFIPTGEPDVFIEADEVILAIGQERKFDWIEKDLGIAFKENGMPVVDPATFASTLPKVFFGGDAALGPRNVITAVAQGHEAAISIDLFCQGKNIDDRPTPQTHWYNTKMGIHEWTYDNAVSIDDRFLVPHADKNETLHNIKKEVELGFDKTTALKEAERCLNCDVETIFDESKCIECDACRDICPTNCINFTTNEATEEALRAKLIVPATNTTQELLVSDVLKTGKIMVKDEDVCLHCGLCAERCPTAAWDMKRFLYNAPKTIN